MEKKKAIKILKRARDLVSKGWCRHPLATDKNRKVVAPCSKEAVSFCAVGALERSYHENGEGYSAVGSLPKTTLKNMVPFCDIVHFNDKAKDKRYVLRLYARAIKSLENS